MVSKMFSRSTRILLVVLTINSFSMLAMSYTFYWRVHMVDKIVAPLSPRAPAAVNPFQSSVLPLETLVVNLSGSKGRRAVKVDLEIKLSTNKARLEASRRMAEVRGILIILLSSKTYQQIHAAAGKFKLRAEIKNNISGILSSGRVDAVYFTNFVYN